MFRVVCPQNGTAVLNGLRVLRAKNVSDLPVLLTQYRWKTSSVFTITGDHTK